MGCIGGVVLVMARGNVRVRGGGERRGLRSRHYFVWVVDDEREVGEGAEAFEAAFIGVVRRDRTIVHLFFHEGEALDLSSDRGDCLKGCSKAFADVVTTFSPFSSPMPITDHLPEAPFAFPLPSATSPPLSLSHFSSLSLADVAPPLPYLGL